MLHFIQKLSNDLFDGFVETLSIYEPLQSSNVKIRGEFSAQ